MSPFSMSPRRRRGHTSNSTMQLTQTNWDAIPPVGQDDILGVVGFSIHNKSIYTNNTTLVSHRLVFFVQSVTSTKERSHK
jgi:hypothetical protein